MGTREPGNTPVIRSGDPLPPRWTGRWVRSALAALADEGDPLIAEVRRQGLLSVLARLQAGRAHEVAALFRGVVGRESVLAARAGESRSADFATAHGLPDNLLAAGSGRLSEAHLAAVHDRERLRAGADGDEVAEAERAVLVLTLAWNLARANELGGEFRAAHRAGIDAVVARLETEIAALTGPRSRQGLPCVRAPAGPPGKPRWGGR